MGNISHVSAFYWCQVVQKYVCCKLYSDLKAKKEFPRRIRSGPFLELQHTTISAPWNPWWPPVSFLCRVSMLILSTIPTDHLPYLPTPLFTSLQKKF